MRVDAHHIFRQSGPQPERLWPILERNRFEGSVMIQPEASAELAALALDEANSLEFVKAAAVWVDLASPRLGQRLDLLRNRSSKFKAIFHEFGDAADWLEVSRHRLPVNLSIQPGQLSQVLQVAESTPALTVIVDNLGSPVDFESWALQVEKVAQVPTIAVKISGLLTVNHPSTWNSTHLKPYVQHAIATFGPDRLLFGSGWPDCLTAGTWKESLAAFTQSIGAHSIDFREKLLGGTAARLYNFLT